jgi:hypothetical protein
VVELRKNSRTSTINLTTTVAPVDRAALAGTLAACLAIFGSRWGSYLGSAPIFLTDILIGVAVCHLAASRERHLLSLHTPCVTHALLSLLLLWVTVRFLAGGHFGVIALRDAAPYFYALLALVSAAAFTRSSPANRERTARLFMLALTGHAIWCVASVLWPTLSSLMPLVAPSQGLHLFSVRPDFDLAVLGVYTACLFTRLIKGTDRPALTTLWLMLCWVAILNNHSRAGLLGAITASVLVLFICLQGQHEKMSRKLALLGILPLLMATVLFIIPQTQVGGRLTGTSGAGSQRARSDTWDRLWHYSLDSSDRFAVGVGFGPNFMAESGAGLLLVGSNEESEVRPRSPHNYWVGTLVRTGLVGVSLSLALLLATLARIRLLLPRLYNDPLLFLSALTVVALIMPATLGVVLESPFGAVPYFWCIGILFAAQSSTTKPSPPPTRQQSQDQNGSLPAPEPASQLHL